jgi:large subunit ribosomal protein L47
MLSLSRHASNRIPRSLLRSFAQIVEPNRNPGLDSSEVDTPPGKERRRKPKKLDPIPPAEAPSTSSSRITNKVAVREDHGLYAFFRRKPQKPDSPELVGEDRYEVVETPEEGQLITGALFPTRFLFDFADVESQAEVGRPRNCEIRVSRICIPCGM